MLTTESIRRNNARGNSTKQTHKFDKQLINVTVATNNTQVNTVLTTCTYPCVIMGVLINGASIQLYSDNADLLSSVQYMLLVLEQGTTVSNITYNGTAFAPEQQVMAYGAGILTPVVGYSCSCKTKTGRKMRAGDQLVFAIRSNNVANVFHNYTIQFFCKV